MRTTITLNDTIYKQLKRRAFDSGLSVSAYVQDAVKYQILEDVEDLEEIERRLAEPTITHDELVKQFKAEGLL